MTLPKIFKLGAALLLVGAPLIAAPQQTQTAPPQSAVQAAQPMQPAQAVSPGQQNPPTAAQASAVDNHPADTDTARHERHPRYQVQREDILAIAFPLSPEFDQTVTIQPDGYVSLQGIPGLYIEGMTVPQVVEAVKKAYSGTLHDPIVQVDLQDFQRPFFTVSGQVGKPGQYELRHDTTVAEAIGVAGGFSSTAKTQVFLFHRVSTGWFEVKKLNMNDVFNGKNINEDPSLGPGDMVFVPEKFITKFRKYVPYFVGTSISPSFY